MAQDDFDSIITEDGADAGLETEGLELVTQDEEDNPIDVPEAESARQSRYSENELFVDPQQDLGVWDENAVVDEDDDIPDWMHIEGANQDEDLDTFDDDESL